MEERVKQNLKAQEAAMIEDLKTIVNIDSGSYDKAGIDQVIQFFREKYEALGFEVTIDHQDKNGNNLVARKKGTIPGNYLFLGHVDTVFAKGTVAQRPFTIQGERAYGPGVCDMKGGDIILYYVLKTLLHSGVTDYPTFTVVLNGDEELGSPTSRPLIEREAKDATHCFVLEAGRPDGSVVTARKGVGIFDLKVKGVASHAGSNHAEGKSAIEELAHKIIAMHGLTDYNTGTTVNIGVIEGGSRPNIVAGYAKAKVDLRVTSIQAAEMAIEQLQKIAAQTFILGTQTTFEGELNRPPLAKFAESQHLFEVFQRAAELVGIEHLAEVTAGGGSDGNFTSALGVPTIDGLGPIGGEAHNEHEYIELSSLVLRAQLLAQALILLNHEMKIGR